MAPRLARTHGMRRALSPGSAVLALMTSASIEGIGEA
jgi:hypothetical protein